MKKFLITVLAGALLAATVLLATRFIENHDVSRQMDETYGIVYYGGTDGAVRVLQDEGRDAYDIYMCWYSPYGTVEEAEYRGRYTRSNLMDGVNDTVRYYYAMKENRA